MLSYLKYRLTGFNAPQKGGGGGGTSTTVQSIPEELKPLASAYTKKAIALSEQPYTPYTGQRYADLNQTQTDAMDMVKNRATQGSQTMNAAESALQSQLNPGTNPYLDQMVNSAMGKAGAAVNSQFSGSNYGTTAHQGTLSETLGNVAANMYGNQYNQDMNRQLNAIQMAPTFGNAAYQDANQLMNVGQMLQDQQQQGLDFNYQQFMEEMDLPYKQLAAMGGVFGSNLGGTSTTTSNQSGGGGK